MERLRLERQNKILGLPPSVTHLSGAAEEMNDTVLRVERDKILFNRKTPVGGGWLGPGYGWLSPPPEGSVLYFQREALEIFWL